VVWGLVEGLQIGLPPLLHFGSAALKARVAPDCLQGRKVICLCISEPYAGSDVAALRTTAVKDASGQVSATGGTRWRLAKACSSASRRSFTW
jgi:alkylation response protein AidB-like acyl-CoA dehydrogenase